MAKRMAQEKTTLGRRVVLFPFSFQGHIAPMLQLGSILYTKGFSISVVHTSYNGPKVDDYPHFKFHCIDVGLSKNEVSMSSNQDIFRILIPFNERCSEPFKDCLSELLVSCKEEDEPVACLVIDNLWYFSQGIAKDLGVPTMVLRTSSIATLIGFSDMPSMVEKGYLPIQDDRDLEAEVPGFAPMKFKDLPVTKGDILKEFVKLVSMTMHVLETSKGVITNSFEELEDCAFSKNFQDSIAVPAFTIGPFHKYGQAPPSSLWTHDRTCISWLDKQAHGSVLYVSFGSLAQVSEAQFSEIAWGLADSNQPFLWAIRPTLVLGLEGISDLLPDEFIEMVGERGHIVKWAPQQEVLAHPSTGGFWTHSGWNSTLESITGGVPMICTPNFADQMLDARFVADVWKVGIELEMGQLERKKIEKAIRRLMVDKEGQEMRERMQHLKEKAHNCLHEGGSSYKSLENLCNYILSM